MRWLLRITVLLAVLAIAAAGIAAAWLATSESALAWLAARAVAVAGGRLEITDVRGFLAGTIRVGRLRYEDEDFRMTVEEVALEPVLVAVLVRRVELKTLAARNLEVVIKPTPPATPDSLAPPLAVGIGRAAIGRIVVRSDPDEIAFDDVSFAYEGSATRHALTEVKGRSAFGTLAGVVAFGAARSFPASGSASLMRADAKLPVAF